MYKVYFHRFGAVQFEEYNTIGEAEDFVYHEEYTGNLFADCIVDEEGIIIRDFNAETNVIGRELPESRLGKRYTEN